MVVLFCDSSTSPMTAPLLLHLPHNIPNVSNTDARKSTRIRIFGIFQFLVVLQSGHVLQSSSSTSSSSRFARRSCVSIRAWNPDDCTTSADVRLTYSCNVILIHHPCHILDHDHHTSPICVGGIRDKMYSLLLIASPIRYSENNSSLQFSYNTLNSRAGMRISFGTASNQAPDLMLMRSHLEVFSWANENDQENVEKKFTLT
jgi:hypothetical protein